jgi:aconitate hydratase
MNSFGTRGSLSANGKAYTLYKLDALPGEAVRKLPWSMKVLLENLLRKEDGRVVRREHIEAVLN